MKKIWTNFTDKKICSYVSICEMETQILLAGDLGFIEKSEWGTIKKEVAEFESM